MAFSSAWLLSPFNTLVVLERFLAVSYDSVIQARPVHILPQTWHQLFLPFSEKWYWRPQSGLITEGFLIVSPPFQWVQPELGRLSYMGNTWIIRVRRACIFKVKYIMSLYWCATRLSLTWALPFSQAKNSSQSHQHSLLVDFIPHDTHCNFRIKMPAQAQQYAYWKLLSCFGF